MLFQPFLSCSKNTNNKTVLGPSRMNAGVQPLKRTLGPSSRMEVVRTCRREASDEEDMIRVRMTSAGEQTVVATVPANKLAVT